MLQLSILVFAVIFILGPALLACRVDLNRRDNE